MNTRAALQQLLQPHPLVHGQITSGTTVINHRPTIQHVYL